MTVNDIVEKLADTVRVGIIFNDYGVTYGCYTYKDDINEYKNYNVKHIDTTEYGTLVMVVDRPIE